MDNLEKQGIKILKSGMVIPRNHLERNVDVGVYFR